MLPYRDLDIETKFIFLSFTLENKNMPRPEYSRSWCGTWFPVESETIPITDIPNLRERFRTLHSFRYVCFQVEATTSTSRHHLQFYVELSATRHWRELKAAFPSVHLEKRRGTRAQAKEYCEKTDTRVHGPYELGEWLAGGSGARFDIASMSEQILSGVPMGEVVRADPVTYIRYGGNMERLRRYVLPTERVPPKVILCFGDTGVGKTAYVHRREDLLDIYTKGPGHEWFDGYDDHEVLLLDDFAGANSKMTLTTVLQLLDRYNVQLQVKGGMVQLRSERIYITTNIHPSLWYNYDGRIVHYRALMRRMTQVVCFTPSLDGQSPGTAFAVDHQSFTGVLDPADAFARRPVDFTEVASGAVLL